MPKRIVCITTRHGHTFCGDTKSEHRYTIGQAFEYGWVVCPACASAIIAFLSDFAPATEK